MLFLVFISMITVLNVVFRSYVYFNEHIFKLKSCMSAPNEPHSDNQIKK